MCYLRLLCLWDAHAHHKLELYACTHANELCFDLKSKLRERKKHIATAMRENQKPGSFI